jgi:CO dehydrogenase maturation factor
MCDTPGHDHSHDHSHGHDHHHDHGAAHDRGHDAFRIVVSGKGGVGKTSLTAVLARLLARQDYAVLAVDADPQMNLPYAIGVPRARARALAPLGANAEYVEEKTGVRPGSGWGVFLRLNPDVDDVVDRFGIVGPDGVRLVVMGTVVQPAAGCLCPENSLLSSVVRAIGLRDNEVILMDTQAGVEHFGRALAEGFHHAAVVTDPTFNGVQVALHAARLARELGIDAVHLVINRVRTPADVDKVRSLIADEGGFDFTSEHALPYDDLLLAAEPAVDEVLARVDTPFVTGVTALRDALIRSEQELLACAS